MTLNKKSSNINKNINALMKKYEVGFSELLKINFDSNPGNPTIKEQINTLKSLLYKNDNILNKIGEIETSIVDYENPRIFFNLKDANGDFSVKDTLFLIINELKKKHNVRINPNILTDNYQLSYITKPNNDIEIYNVDYGKNLIGLSANIAKLKLKIGEQLGGTEILQLFILDNSFIDFFRYGLGYYYLLSNIVLINKQNEKDNIRTLCVYTVSDYLVIDRASVDYEIPWNSSLLLQKL